MALPGAVVAARLPTTAVGTNTMFPPLVGPLMAAPTSLTATTSTVYAPAVLIVKVQLGVGPSATLAQAVAVPSALV